MGTQKGWILIVEDDNEFSIGLRDALQSDGYGVVAAATPTEANVKLGNQAFKAVLLDLHLNNGSGEQVISFVRHNRSATNQNLHTPILVMSGFVDSAVLQRIKKEVNGVLVKPIDKAALLKKLSSVLNPSAS